MAGGVLMVTGLVWVVSGVFAVADFFSVGFLRGPV